MVMSDGALKTQIVPGIIDKCLASTRAGTRSKALDILLVLVELDGPDYVIVSSNDLLLKNKFIL
jgi:hypothetical protein